MLIILFLLCLSPRVDVGIDCGTCEGAQTTPGCDVPEIESCVCTQDPYCCSPIGEWDGKCADLVEETCDFRCLSRTFSKSRSLFAEFFHYIFLTWWL